MSQKYDQFFDIVLQAVEILCPGKDYEPVELVNGEKGIHVSNENLFYTLTFKSSQNIIHVQIREGERNGKKLGDLTYKLGSISVAELVDAVRKAEKPEMESPFAALLKLTR